MLSLKKILVPLSIFVVLVILSSCKKNTEDDDRSPDNQTTADNIFSESQNIADEAADKGSVSFKTDDMQGTLSGCATVSIDSSNAPTRVITIDFGTGCTGNDGKVRAGKMIVTADGRYRDAGTHITIHYDSYSVNGNQVSNSSVKEITNNGLNSSGNFTWTISVNGSVVLASNGGTVTWVSNRVREQIAGASTPHDIFDDKYSITGSGSGTNALGLNFTAQINAAKPLVRDMSCSVGKRNFVSGEITLTPSGKPARVIDFGTGTCDNVITVTVNGRTRTIYI